MNLRFVGLVCLSFSFALNFGAADESTDVAAHFADRLSTFENVYIEFTQRPTVPRRSSNVPIFSTRKSFARKGIKRYYDVVREHIAGPQPSRSLADSCYTGLTFDGQETRILFSKNNIRVFAGDETDQFDNGDDFLSLQGYPSKHFWSYDSVHKKKVFFNFADFVGNYGLTKPSESGIVQLEGPSDRLFLDPQRGYAVVKRELLDSAGSVIQRFEYSDFFEFKNCWLAEKITKTTFKAANKRSTLITQLVSIRDDRIDDSLFQMPFHSHASVENFAIGKDNNSLLVYVVPTDPNDLDKVIADAIRRNEAYESSATSGIFTRRIFLAVNIAIVCLVGLIFVLRKFKS